MSGSPSSYRDQIKYIYIIKDIILKLVEYGELNQTALISFGGLNLKKHKNIFWMTLKETAWSREGKIQLEGGLWPFIDQRKKGDIAFCRDILEPYEKVFPRKKNENKQPTLHTGKRLSGFGSTHVCACVRLFWRFFRVCAKAKLCHSLEYVYTYTYYLNRWWRARAKRNEL
jgi:hypothetical protein